MKKLLIALLTIMLTLQTTVAADGWLTNIDEAKKTAAKKNLPILVDFSGSDWCGWCIKLEKEVFSKSEFKKFSKDNVILLLVDFPNKKKQSAAQKKHNMELAQKFGIRGFPTILLLDKNGKKLAQTGYKPGGVKNYISHLKELINNSK